MFIVIYSTKSKKNLCSSETFIKLFIQIFQHRLKNVNRCEKILNMFFLHEIQLVLRTLHSLRGIFLIVQYNIQFVRDMFE